MKYKEMDCGIRVKTPKGEGVVRSYTAEVPELRNLFADLGSSKGKDPVATVALDSGETRDFPIRKLTRVGGNNG